MSAGSWSISTTPGPDHPRQRRPERERRVRHHRRGGGGALRRRRRRHRPRRRICDSDPFVSGSRGDLVNDIAQGIGAVIQQQDGNIFGRTDVYLEGRRHEVRTEETNLGDLSSDAASGMPADRRTVMVSIRNGGGIRDSIGRVEAVGGRARSFRRRRTRRSTARKARSRSSTSPTRCASTTRSRWSR